MRKGHRTELGCREEPILTPCWNCFFDLLFVAFVIIIIHTDLPQRTLSLFLTVKLKCQASQWLRIPKQRTLVWSLIQEDPTCPGATKPVCAPVLWSKRAATIEPQSLFSTTRDATAMRGLALQLENSPRLLQLEKSLHTAKKTQHSQKWN